MPTPAAVAQPESPAGPLPHRSASVITTERQLKEMVAAYSDFEAYAFDFETRGELRNDPRHAIPFWVSFAGPGRADVIPFGHPLGDVWGYDIPMTKDGSRPLKNRKPIALLTQPPGQLMPEAVFDGLEPLFFNKALKIGHNLKFDLEVAASIYDGVWPGGPYFDTQIAAFLIDETHLGGFPYSLGQCVEREFKYVYDKSLGRIGVEKFPFSESARYSRLDSKYTWLLYRRYRRQIAEAKLDDLFDLEMRVLACVVWMEEAGVEINEEGLDKLTATVKGQMDAVQARINTAAGWEVNVNADEQIRRLLFGEKDAGGRGHQPHPYYTTEKKGVPQVSAAALTATRSLRKDPVAADITKWLELSKLHGTYLLNIKRRMLNGRCHADFDQRGARTGRFSCRTPNLQNIPTRRSKEVRELFIAPPGHKLIVADYSQIELRVLAHFSKDPKLIQAYVDGLNLHKITAMRAYHVAEEDLTELQYSRAKNCNFSMAYGAQASTLVEKYGVGTLTEAQSLIDAFFDTYARVDPWRRSEVRACKRRRITRLEAEQKGCRPQRPYVETILGRRRHLPDLFSYNFKLQAQAERQCINTKIQGSAGDILKLAMADIHGRLLGSSSVLMLTVHDELVVQAPDAEAEWAAEETRQAMEDVLLPVTLRVPLVADIKIVDRWSEK